MEAPIKSSEIKETIKWKPCPNCKRSIPDFWTYDERCGWNVTPEVESKILENEKNMQMKNAMAYLEAKFSQRANIMIACRDFVLKEFKITDFPDHRTALVDTLFIEMMKEK